MASLQTKPSLWPKGLSLHWVLMVPLALSITSSTALAGCLLYPPMPPTSRPLLLLALGAIAPAIVQGLILRRVLAQLKRVSQVSRELAAGHLSHRLPTDSPGVELRQLARAINQLADQTQQSLQGMQTALTASEQWLAQYSQISPSMIYTFVEVIEGDISEQQGRFEYISAALEEVGEVSVEAGLQDANAVRRLIHPDDAAGYLVAELESKQTLGTFSHQCRIVTPSGRVKWVHTQSQPQRRADGTVAWYGVVVDISLYKQAEVALQESETRFRQLAEAVEEGFFVFDTEASRYSYLNPAILNLTGDPVEPSPDEPAYARGMAHWLNNIHPEDRHRVEAQLQEERHGEPLDAEYRFQHLDGRLLWLRSKAFPIQDETGKTVRIVGTVEDITQQKSLEQQLRSELIEHQETEARLQEREALLRAIGDNLPKGFIYQFVHEPGKGFNFEYISAGIEQVVGLKPEEAVGHFEVVADLIVEEDLQLVQKANQESLENLSLYEVEMRKWTTWGELQWSIVRSTPHRLEDGRTIWYGLEIDITNLKQTEAALKDSEELFRRAFDDAPIGVSLIAPDGKFLKVNSYYCNLLGYTQDELLQMNFQELTHPDDLETDLGGLSRMERGETQTFQMEKRYISKQGETIPVFLQASFVRDGKGNPLYCIGNIQDIRERLAIDRMKDEFISVVSHELRTPITAIQGALVMLGAGVYKGRPEKAQHMLDIAINNSDRLVRLVDDILSFERLESGKVQLEKEDCAVAYLLYQAIDAVQHLADQSGITLALTPLTATLWAAPDGIIQVLTNLLSNAIKFSSPGGTVWVNARTERLEDSTSDLSVLFTVQDHGRGIPADKLEVIFDQFQQVDASDSRRRGGTGLGLAICKRIVQQHQGQIWVESVVGQGSTFYVALPLAREDGHD